MQSGIIGVIGSNNQTLGIWMDNPDLIASLSECTTINEEISRKCNDVLKEAMLSLTGRYGQVAVLVLMHRQGTSKHGWLCRKTL